MNYAKYHKKIFSEEVVMAKEFSEKYKLVVFTGKMSFSFITAAGTPPGAQIRIRGGETLLLQRFVVGWG
jgi:hypothetical protein